MLWSPSLIITRLWWFVPSWCLPSRSWRQASSPRRETDLLPGILTCFLFSTTKPRGQLFHKNLSWFFLFRIHPFLCASGLFHSHCCVLNSFLSSLHFCFPQRQWVCCIHLWLPTVLHSAWHMVELNVWSLNIEYSVLINIFCIIQSILVLFYVTYYMTYIIFVYFYMDIERSPPALI